MSIDLTHAIVIDQHAHSIYNDFLQIDEIGFRKCFSESRSLKMLESHVHTSVHYMDLIKQVSRLFDVPGERQFFEIRQSMREYDHINCLFDDVSVGALIIDDGYGTSEMMSLGRLADLLHRPVYRCLRLETLLERSIDAGSSFDEMMSQFMGGVRQTGDKPTVALKSIAAYRGGLEIEAVAQEDARADFVRLKSSFNQALGHCQRRIEKSPLYHFALVEAFELAGQLGLPVQLHCGLGDSDEDLRTANPLCLRNLLESKRFQRTTFVLLHCYPFVREAAYLASLYPNVYMDLSLASFMISGYFDQIILDAISAAPSSKILAASDGHSVPETHWFGNLSLKRALTAALSSLTQREIISEDDAYSVAGAILYGNARRIYNLEGMV